MMHSQQSQRYRPKQGVKAVWVLYVMSQALGPWVLVQLMAMFR